MTEQELEDFIDRFVIEELPENTVLVNPEKCYMTKEEFTVFCSTHKKEGKDPNET